jgi:SAM-dependent methyltransferase
MTSYVLRDPETSRRDITVSDLQIMAGAHNYRRWMYKRISLYIGRRILEVGAGIGNFTSLLRDREFVVPVDVHPECVRILQENMGNDSRIKPMQLDLTDTDAFRNLQKNAFDTVICFNVLEHVSDDAAALANIYEVLQPNGKAILLVPAFTFLYGTVDEALGHFRRYSKKELTSKMQNAGFEIESKFFMNVIGMFGWFFNNRIIKKKEESAHQILFFDRLIAPVAELLERWIPPPVGLSLIVVGKKNAHD